MNNRKYLIEQEEPVPGEFLSFRLIITTPAGTYKGRIIHYNPGTDVETFVVEDHTQREVHECATKEQAEEWAEANL